MKNVKGWITLQCYMELPDHDLESDDAFDKACQEVEDVLNMAFLASVIPQSFSVKDAEAEEVTDD